MNEIQNQIRRARRRLLLSAMIQAVTWSTCGALLIALVAIVLPKFWPVGAAEHTYWAVSWLAGGLAVGVLAGTLWAVFRQHDELDAAIEIDLRYGLKERVSSAFALQPDELDTPAGRALVEDASRRVGRIDVREHFRPRVSWHPLLPVLIGLCACAMALFVQNAATDAAAATRNAELEKKQIRRSVEELKKRLANRKTTQGLQDADAVIKKVQRAVDEISQQNADRKKVLVKLNNLTQQLAERRDSVAASKEARDTLRQLQNTERGPADRVADALKQGDMDKALDELKKLSDKLRSDSLTPAEKEQLTKQIDKIREELEKSLGVRQELANKKEELKQQIEQLRREGKMAEAGDLQQKLDQVQQQLNDLDQQSPQLSKLQDMANQLNDCAQCLKEGNGQQAADKLDQLASQLQEMKSELENLETLNEMMDEIADAKQAMSCDSCQGDGCAECQGGGNMGGGQQDGKPGQGLGAGRGMGERPEQETETGGYRARVAGDPRQGEAVRIGDAGGPNMAGKSSAEVQQEIASSFSKDPAPPDHQQLPRREREQTREYFDLLRKGE